MLWFAPVAGFYGKKRGLEASLAGAIGRDGRKRAKFRPLAGQRRALEEGGFAEGFGADVGEQGTGVEVGGAIGDGEAEFGEGDEVAEQNGGVFEIGGVEAGAAVAEHAGGVGEAFPLALEAVDMGIAGEVEGDFYFVRARLAGEVGTGAWKSRSEVSPKVVKRSKESLPEVWRVHWAMRVGALPVSAMGVDGEPEESWPRSRMRVYSVPVSGSVPWMWRR